MQHPLYCPCAEIADDTLATAKSLYKQAIGIQDFVRLMNERSVKGKWIAYDPACYKLTIAKRYGCECEREGEACAACPPSCKCHCHLVCDISCKSPLAHCQCGAEYYRPLFEEIFGVPLTLYPEKTVLSGDERCIIVIELPQGFVKE